MRRSMRVVAIQQITKPVKDGELASTIKAVVRILDAQFHDWSLSKAVLNSDMKSCFSVMSSQYNISTPGSG